jgi:predicted nucleic acid-binding protein
LPTSRGEATGSLRTPSRQHWDLFVNLCANIQGPLVADAYLAALAIEHGCELIATDSDFARFKGLRWRHPLSA